MRSVLVRAFLAPTILALATGCATQAPAPPPVDQEAIRAEITASDAAFFAAVAARDTNALVAMYTEDARVLPANGPAAVGTEAIRKVWIEFLATPGLALTGATGEVIVSEAGDLAVSIGRYDMAFTGPRNKAMRDVGKFVTVFRKTDAGWRILVDTWNSDTPLGP